MENNAKEILEIANEVQQNLTALAKKLDKVLPKITRDLKKQGLTVEELERIKADSKEAAKRLMKIKSGINDLKK